MKLKKFLVGFSTFILTTVILYTIGYTFKISWLMWHYEYEDTRKNLYVISGSILPFIAGIILSFIAERIYVNKNHKKFIS
jgi:hypothetical protein